jgi:hypothetical protein
MKKIKIRGVDIPTQVEFDMVSKGKYWIQNFWGCQVRMEKSDNAIGWGDQWFVEVYHKRGTSDHVRSWVSTCAFQPTRRDCVDYLLRIAKASLEGKQITFRHRVMIDAEGMWAGRALPHPYFKTVLKPNTRRRVNNGV